MGTRKLIVVGDITTGGGTVATGSAGTDIDGVPVARVNDKCTCPKHKGVFPIVTGDVTFIVDGQPVAREGDYLACGCRLISVRQFRVFLDDCTHDDPAADKVVFKRTNLAGQATDAGGGQRRVVSASEEPHAAAKHMFDRRFALKNNQTGLPLAGIKYRLRLEDGQELSGVTDSAGMTARVAADKALKVELEMIS